MLFHVTRVTFKSDRMLVCSNNNNTKNQAHRRRICRRQTCRRPAPHHRAFPPDLTPSDADTDHSDDAEF